MSNDKSRRRFLALTGSTSLVGLAGCLGIGGGDDEPAEEPRRLLEGSLDTPIPEGQEECVSLDGDVRDPDSVSEKEEVDYQFHPEYDTQRNISQMCANCTFFCKSQGQNRVGACTAVAGGIRSQDWCALWQPAELVERSLNRE